MRLRVISFLTLVISFFSSAEAQDLDWPEPETVNRPGAIWWWMGSAVDKPNLTSNLETMRENGMGGVTIVPIYGAKGFEDRYIEHLTPEWIEMMSFTVAEADRLGMWVDMTPGTGWPFGGPMVEESWADMKAEYRPDPNRGDDADAEKKLVTKFSGRTVKRAAPGGKGMSINPFSPSAMSRYLEHFDGPLSRPGVKLPRALYHDSFEFQGNWQPDLPDEFVQRRGYDLADYYQQLFVGGDPETVARIKSDYRQTLSELHLEYMQTLQQWATERGCQVRNQAHGAPANLLDVYAAASIPETETFGASRLKIPGVRMDPANIRSDPPHPLINRMGSSAAHVAGRPLVASESCTWIRNHFRAALSQVKPEIDWMFLNGVNHVLFHGTCYSPDDVQWPGWLFYASLQYNPRNAIWRDSKFLNEYITRCQSILQSGQPDNDVALYWPVFDIWHDADGLQQQLTVHHTDWLVKSKCGQVADWLMNQGYGFDFISDRQLIDGKSKPYQAIIVPATEHIPLATLEKLYQLADAGQPVLFLDSLPGDVPGYHQFEDRRVRLQQLNSGREELVAPFDELAAALEQTDVARESMSSRGLRFIRRKHDAGHHYFVANMTAEPIREWIELGVPFRSAVLMDPMSARTGVAARDSKNQVFLDLKPGETRILRTFNDREVAGKEWPQLQEQPAGAVVIEGQWQVEFIDGAPALPDSFATDLLRSWTELGGEAAQRFAGTAKYSIEFDLADPTAASDWLLQLGDVRESARVSVNGKSVGAAINFPFELNVGGALQLGTNRLDVEVTNLSANRLRDLDSQGVPWKNFHDINIVNHNYKELAPRNWKLSPSGLLGPVTLTPLVRRPRLVLIGDSTVKNGSGKGDGGLYGWGQVVDQQFDTARIDIENRARGGLSSRTYMTSELWEQSLARLGKGDYLLIQFGHNDGGEKFSGNRPRASIKGNGDETETGTVELTGKQETVHSYGWYLRKFVAEAKQQGAIPIILSPVPRDCWKGGKIVHSDQDYGLWARQAAQQSGAHFIDLNEIVATRYEQLGEEQVGQELFPETDWTHTTLAGAVVNAECVAAGIRGLEDCGLKEFLADDQAASQWKFDFGTGKTVDGFQQVLPEDLYDPERGFGFELVADLSSVQTGQPGERDGDAIQGQQSIYFSVELPEGSYRVRLRSPQADLQIKTELRRWSSARATPLGDGKGFEYELLANTRRPEIGNGNSVRLKSREQTSEKWSWDEKLTIEACAETPAISSIEIEPVDDVVTVYLAGDSTVADTPSEPWNSWGQMITRFFKPTLVVANHSEGGESVRSSLGARRFDKIFSLIQPGDYLIFQYGHNDQKEKAVDKMETYAENLRKLIKKTRDHGAHPILVTSMERQRKPLANTLGAYPDVMRQLGQELDVPVIDLNAASMQLYAGLGDRLGDAFQDATHHNNYGSWLLAKCVVQGIRELNLDLAKYVVDDFEPVDLADPPAEAEMGYPPSKSQK